MYLYVYRNKEHKQMPPFEPIKVTSTTDETFSNINSITKVMPHLEFNGSLGILHGKSVEEALELVARWSIAAETFRSKFTNALLEFNALNDFFVMQKGGFVGVEYKEEPYD